MSLLPLEPGSWQAELENQGTEILKADRALRRLGLNDKKDWLTEDQLALRTTREVQSARPTDIDRLLYTGLYRRAYNPLAGTRPTRRGRYSRAQDPWQQDSYETFEWLGVLPSYSRPDRLVEGGEHYTWDIMLPQRCGVSAHPVALQQRYSFRMENPPTPEQVRQRLAEIQDDNSGNPFRAAVRLLTGFTDAQLDELGGFTTH